MPFFVAIYQEAPPERVQEMIATVRSRLAASRTAHPGRQSARVFQRIEQPTHFLSIGEWETQAAYERERESASFFDTGAAHGPAPTIEYLQRLHLFVRMDQRPGVIACATISAPADRIAAVEAFLRGSAQHDVVGMPGLISRELYRSGGGAARLLVVHGWRTLADLERFRTSDAPSIESALASLGASVERFTGEIAAQYSVFDRSAEP